MHNNNTERQRKPSFELISPQQQHSFVYRQHGYPHPLVCWHYHQEYELHLITQSSGKVFIGDYIGNFYPNSLILTGPNLPHNWITETTDNESYLDRDKLITFTDQWIDSASAVIPEMKAVDDLLQKSRCGVEFLDSTVIQKVADLLGSIPQSSRLGRLSVFMQIMALLVATDDYQLLSSDSYQVKKDDKKQARVNQAVNFVFENYQQDIKLEEVAEHLGMQPTYFSKFFRRATGRKFVEFVINLRITRACDLLVNSDAPITNICFDVGFSNISNFNRHFHSYKGMTPSKYRQLSPIVMRKAQNKS
ncbi:MAG: AraC family transcriptional regulator [Oceanospirillaceae bacterium]|nr:AraC family transcriptional regulator [Oceanospirillaceae bacterium]